MNEMSISAYVHNVYILGYCAPNIKTAAQYFAGEMACVRIKCTHLEFYSNDESM